jgi:hypothetical protein
LGVPSAASFELVVSVGGGLSGASGVGWSEFPISLICRLHLA